MNGTPNAHIGCHLNNISLVYQFAIHIQVSIASLQVSYFRMFMFILFCLSMYRFSKIRHKHVTIKLVKINSFVCSRLRVSNIVDVVLQRLETYSNNLEGLVDQRTQQLVQEKHKSDKLLYRMLPK